MGWRLGNGKLRKDQTDTYGKIRGGSKPLLTDFEDSDSIHYAQSASTSKITSVIKSEIMEIINNALTASDLVSSEDITIESTYDSISFVLNDSLKEKIEDSITAGDLKNSTSVNKVIDAIDGKVKFEINSDILEKITNSLTEDDWEDSASITIGKNPTTSKLYGALATDISNKINNSLQIPSQIATEKKLVGVGISRNQIDVSMGETMEIDTNNKLNLKGELKEKVLGALSSSDLEDTEDITISKDSSNKIHFNLDSDIKDKIDDSLVYTDLESSEDIIVDTETGKVIFTLDNTVSNKINNSLQTPLSTPTATELVGIDTSKAQQRISIGSGLAIINNVLTTTSAIEPLWVNNNPTVDFSEQTINIDITDYDYIIIKYKVNLEGDNRSNYVIFEKAFNTINCEMSVGNINDNHIVRSITNLSNNGFTITNCIASLYGTVANQWIIPLVIYGTNNPIGNN